jgi:hypothetical protein
MEYSVYSEEYKMSELYDKIIEQRGGFENIVARIPGFRGYLDNKARREADRLIRDHLADQFSARVSQFVAVEKVLLNSDGLAYMGKSNAVKTNLQHFRDRVQTAAPGYSGPFEQVKVTPEDLEAVYSFDEAMIRYVDQFDDAIGALEAAVSAKTGIDEALAAIDKLTREANQAFDLRTDILTQLSKGLGTGMSSGYSRLSDPIPSVADPISEATDTVVSDDLPENPSQ